MQSKKVMKKLVDNYETLVFVSKRYPSSMSRLKNLLMSEGVSETSARRKIADLETEAGYLVLERNGGLKLNAVCEAICGALGREQEEKYRVVVMGRCWYREKLYGCLYRQCIT